MILVVALDSSGDQIANLERSNLDDCGRGIVTRPAGIWLNGVERHHVLRPAGRERPRGKLGSLHHRRLKPSGYRSRDP